MSDADPIPTCTAIVVAAGSSRRMGFDKLAALLAGKPVLQRTLEALAAAESITEVVVVCPRERWESLGLGDFPKPLKRVDGGAERQDSVAAGLAEVSSEYVAVHDGARPLVAPTEIDRCLACAVEHGAAALARRVAETLKRSDADDFASEAVSRENLWFMETPQVFRTELLRAAYAAVLSVGIRVTDEVSALEAGGGRVKFLESLSPNPKITTPADLVLAEAMILS